MSINRLSHSLQIKEILILGVVFLVVVSGIGFGFFSIVKSNQATVAHITAAATLTANAIPRAPAFTNSTLTFSDPLSSNPYHRWFEDADCVFTGGKYHVFVHKAAFLAWCGSSITFADAAIQVDVSVLSGYSAALIFRFNGSGRRYYDFRITDRGVFFLAVRSTFLIPFTYSSAIASGKQKNTLLVIAKGSDFKLYINGVFVGEAQDSSYTSGSICFGVSVPSPMTSGEASFSNLKVYNV